MGVCGLVEGRWKVCRDIPKGEARMVLRTDGVFARLGSVL